MPQHPKRRMDCCGIFHIRTDMSKSLFTVIAVATAMLVCTNATAQQADNFPYPTVPDTLRTAETRALYVMEHYWDRFNFADTTLMHRPETTEQGFANFIDLLPRVAPSTATLGIKAFADHLYNIKPANADDSNTPERIREYFATLTEKYLGDSESPLHNDLLYAQFLDVMSANKFASMAERTRNEYMARNLKKNLPGTTATDFVYIDRNNQQHQLYNLKAKYTLLYFYDPDCDHCHETAAQIATMPETSSPAISVLAIYPYSDSEMWKTKTSRMPATWTEGYSPDGQITTDDIYYIKSVPSVYLLDEEKRVVLKNPSITLLLNTLKKLTATAVK